MNLFCKLFIDAACEHEELVRRLADLTEGTAENWSISTGWSEFNVVRNDDFDAVRRQGHRGFLYFRYFLEIESQAVVDQKIYIAQIGALLASLCDAGMRAIAACDFEDQLPATCRWDPDQ